MKVFNSMNRQELDEYLFHSYVHDSRIQTIEVDIPNRTIKIVLLNKYDCIGYAFWFIGVSAVYGFEGDWIGEKDMVNCVSLDDRISTESFRRLLHKEILEDEYHFTFELFSGSEIHIVSCKVGVETWTDPQK